MTHAPPLIASGRKSLSETGRPDAANARTYASPTPRISQFGPISCRTSGGMVESICCCKISMAFVSSAHLAAANCQCGHAAIWLPGSRASRFIQRAQASSGCSITSLPSASFVVCPSRGNGQYRFPSPCQSIAPGFSASTVVLMSTCPCTGPPSRAIRLL